MPNAAESLSEQQDKSQKEEQNYALKGRGQQGGADLHRRTDIIVSQSTQRAGNRWLRSGGGGLLRVTGACGAPHGVPLGTHAGKLYFEKPGVGTLLSEFYSYFRPRRG